MIYTTYFAQLKNLPQNVFPISICGKAPEWYKGAQYKKLAPKYGFFMEWKQNHDNDYYISHFNSEVLDTLTPAVVLNELQLKLPEDVRAKMDTPVQINNDWHIALVCYEKSKDFCHRHLVAKWLQSNGVQCKEWAKEKAPAAKYKIGATDGGDAGIDLSWVDKLSKVDGAVVIAKCVAPDFYDAVIANKDKLVVHATCTGYGGSVLEPNVPSPHEQFQAVMALVKDGRFPKEKVTIRVDPIIPTTKGIKTAEGVIKMFMNVGFSRFRVSIIDMYPHVRERFKQAGLPLIFGESGFSPSKAQVSAVDEMLKNVSEYWKSLIDRELFADVLRIESCAEPGLTNVIPCGCVSDYDLKLLGLTEDSAANNVGYQRPTCLCYSGKTELLKSNNRCKHGCLYCFWK